MRERHDITIRNHIRIPIGDEARHRGSKHIANAAARRLQILSWRLGGSGSELVGGEEIRRRENRGNS